MLPAQFHQSGRGHGRGQGLGLVYSVVYRAEIVLVLYITSSITALERQRLINDWQLNVSMDSTCMDYDTPCTMYYEGVRQHVYFVQPMVTTPPTASMREAQQLSDRDTWLEKKTEKTCTARRDMPKHVGGRHMAQDRLTGVPQHSL